MSATQVRRVNWKEFNKRSDELLKEFQKTLLPEHADEVIAIDVEGGSYVLGKTPDMVGATCLLRKPADTTNLQGKTFGSKSLVIQIST
jgi:hypothetical protein